MCYKLLENPQITKTKQIKEHICHILSLMIKKYNHSYGACVMIIQTLSHYEHLNQVYADLIETCVKQLGYESILPDILRELRHHINTIDQQKPTSGTAANKENPNLKFYSQFLMELGDRLTVYLRKDLTLIIDYLGKYFEAE
jgi:condensin complex subunit 1